MRIGINNRKLPAHLARMCLKMEIFPVFFPESGKIGETG
jgi:hypothetical protein